MRVFADLALTWSWTWTIFSKECITSDANATGVLVMGLEKAKFFLELHPELQAYLIYSDENGKYQVYETPGIKAIVSEVVEEKKFSLFK